MRRNGRDNRPYLKPVKRIELSEKNTKLRWIAAAVFLGIAVAAITIGMNSVLNTEPGWQMVEVSSVRENCGGDFNLMYDFSDEGSAATAKFRQLTAIYTQAAEDAYRIFSPNVLEEGLGNVAYLNDNVNTPVTVDEKLYAALSQVAEYENRHVFLAPAAVEYNRVFLCENDAEARQYLPEENPDTAAWLQELTRYVMDPAQISLELLGNGQLRLNVSEAYLGFAEEYGIETFLDFGWMTNAFRADYIASVLKENGYTNGYLASFDGFTRNLDERGVQYTFNIFQRSGSDIYLPALMHYAQPSSIVFLRDYPMVELDRWHYYSFESGEVVTAFLDPVDGMDKSALSNLVSYSAEGGCGEVLLQIAPVFIAREFDTDALMALTERGVYSIWCEDTAIIYNDADLELELVSVEGGNPYTLSFAE